MQNNKVCKECNEPITSRSYPCSVDKDGNYTCKSCNYRKMMQKELPEIQSNIEACFKKRNSDNNDWSDFELMVSNFSELMFKFNEKDVEAIAYILENVRERWD